MDVVSNLKEIKPKADPCFFVIGFHSREGSINEKSPIRLWLV